MCEAGGYRPEQSEWFIFLFYGPNCTSGVKAFRASAADRAFADKAGAGYLIGNYANMQCPGAPCFTIPVDSACD
jgi:hypothetical protein